MSGKWTKKPVNCVECGARLMRRLLHPKTGNPITYFTCNTTCKAAYQRRQKPVDEAWLRQKYIAERMDCTEISRIVGRNSKQVWQWLRGYGIQTRPRGANGGAAMTAFKKGQVSPFKGKKQKRGKDSPFWQGGVTPERQSFYASDEWKQVVGLVYERDRKCCRRCGTTQNQAKIAGFKMHVHHIYPFALKDTRKSLGNLVLLCKPCHNFVHSKENGKREFLPPFGFVYQVGSDGTTQRIRCSYWPKQQMILPDWLTDTTGAAL